MENTIALHADDIRVEEHEHISSTTGERSFQQMLLNDADTGMIIKMVRYPKGCMVVNHKHNCGHGFYVLKGRLETNIGNFGPGSFVWFDAGVEMKHGALDEAMDALFISNKTFDIEYL